MPIYEYYCEACDKSLEAYDKMENSAKSRPCKCGNTAKRAILTPVQAISSKTWANRTFKPHFDAQLDEYFSTQDERRQYLEKNGLVGVGPASPEESNNSRILMSKGQYENASKSNTLHKQVSQRMEESQSAKEAREEIATMPQERT